MLETFDFRKHKAEYESKAADAKREVIRAESTGKASVDKATTELEASQVTAKLERRALERIKKQLDNCIIKAPQDGIVVYDRARYWDPESGIRPGGMVHYQQVIFKLPDLTQHEGQEQGPRVAGEEGAEGAEGRRSSSARSSNQVSRARCRTSRRWPTRAAPGTSGA